ncbi:hypothetical protein RHS03_07530, partial [Rhizoctonia solani]
MCAGYLASNSAYTRSSKNAKAALFLKCNASDPNSKGLDEDLDIGGEDQGRDKDESGKEDDYNLNAHCYNNTQTASKPQPASCSLKQPHPSYGATQPTKKARHLTCDEGNDKDNNEDDKDWLSSQPPTLPPKPTTTNICKANKVVEREQACNKALGASWDQAGAKATADPLGPRKGKGKERKDCPLIPRPKPICCKEDNVEDNNKDNKDNKPVQQIYKSIWHVNSMLSLPDADPKPVQQLAQQVPKSICQVNSTPSSSDANPKPVAEPKKGISSCTKGVKAAEKDMKPKKTLQEPKEVSNNKGKGEREEPQSRKKRCLAPKQLEDKVEELEPLPPSLIPQITKELAESQKQKTAKPLANGPKASLSNKVTTQSTGETAQELINTGKACAVGTLKIKLPVPPSDCSLCKHT